MKKIIIAFLVAILFIMFGTHATAAIATQTDATATDATATDASNRNAIVAVIDEDEEIPDTGSESFELFWSILGGIALVAGSGSIIAHKKDK